jgi:multiple antibiotic resistance protein
MNHTTATFPSVSPSTYSGIGANLWDGGLTVHNTPSYAGGLIVGHTAWEMVTARRRLTIVEQQDAADKEDISFTPMAVPIIGGPGAIGVVLGLSTQATHWSDYIGCCLGIGLLGIIVYWSLRLGEPLIEKLGATGLGALNRILEFLILSIAVQLVTNGFFDLLRVSVPNLFR